MSSIVWDFFQKPEGRAEFVACSKCSTVLAYKGTTSGMKKHLKAKHFADYQRCLEQRGIFETQTVNVSQPSEVLLARAFCTGHIPLSFADNPEFVQFCKSLNFMVPDSRRMCSIIEKSNASYMETLKIQLKNVESFVLISDGLSPSKYRSPSFFSIHVSFVNPVTFERKTMLCTIRYGGNLDEKDIEHEIIHCTVEDTGLQMEKCLGTICDNDMGSYENCIGDLYNMPCSGNTVNQILEDFAEKFGINYGFRHKSEAIIECFCQDDESRDMAIRLNKEFNVPIPIPQPIPRKQWGSLFTVLQFYEANYIYFPSIPCFTRNWLIEDEKIAELSKIVKLLQPVYNSLEALTKETAYSSDIVPNLLCLKEELDENDEMAKVLAELIQLRISPYLSNKPILLAMLSDPRYAYIPNLVEPRTWQEVEKLFAEQETHYLLTNPTTSEDSKPSTSVQDSTETAKGVAGYLKRKLKSESMKKDLASEILQYQAVLTTNRPSFDSDPLQFWKEQQHNFPKMTIIARKALTSMASTSPAEKLFRKCSDIIVKGVPKFDNRHLNMYLLGHALAPTTEGEAIEEETNIPQFEADYPMPYTHKQEQISVDGFRLLENIKTEDSYQF